MCETPAPPKKVNVYNIEFSRLKGMEESGSEGLDELLVSLKYRTLLERNNNSKANF